MGLFFFFFFYRGFYCIFSLGGGGLKDLGWFLYFFHLVFFFLKEFLGLVARGLKDFFFWVWGCFFFFSIEVSTVFFLLGGVV